MRLLHYIIVGTLGISDPTVFINMTPGPRRAGRHSSKGASVIK